MKTSFQDWASEIGAPIELGDQIWMTLDTGEPSERFHHPACRQHSEASFFRSMDTRTLAGNVASCCRDILAPGADMIDANIRYLKKVHDVACKPIYHAQKVIDNHLTPPSTVHPAFSEALKIASTVVSKLQEDSLTWFNSEEPQLLLEMYTTFCRANEHNGSFLAFLSLVDDAMEATPERMFAEIHLISETLAVTLEKAYAKALNSPVQDGLFVAELSERTTPGSIWSRMTPRLEWALSKYEVGAGLYLIPGSLAGLSTFSAPLKLDGPESSRRELVEMIMRFHLDGMPLQDAHAAACALL